ncbi:hypothetical protein [Rhodocista pekingensis]|uniref:Uncharacterized protein n=1 Tax=Rhodocista pekingensis TaxID=201185 RepID=A0ABW2KWG1_9PROT
MSFETSVFINCPFDDEYLPLLRPILFCVVDLGLVPRIALESLDSGEARIAKIVRLIRESRFGIHDLSRLKARRKGEFFRLNMPFELGLDVGSRLFGPPEFCVKRCLILEAERYRFQAAISDLSNSDIAVHRNEPELALTEVRNWLVGVAGLRQVPGPAALFGRFNEFMGDTYDRLRGRGYSDTNIEALPVPELMDCMRDWVTGNPRPH